MLFQGSFKSVSRKFQGNFKGVQIRLKTISSSIERISRVFERSSTGVSGKFLWCLRCFKKVPKKFPECFKKVSRLFQECYKED